MTNYEPEKILVNILKHQLQLPDDYGEDNDGFVIPSIFVYNPTISLGHVDKLQICVQSIGSNVVANNNYFDTIDGKFTEIEQIVTNDDVQIDIMSRNSEAKNRRFEIIAALRSIYSQQMQEKCGFKIYQIPNRLVTSNVAEGASMIYRYTLTVSTTIKRQYTKTIDYYDKFRINAHIDDLDNKHEIL